MASLLSWAGREIKGGLQTINRDIVQPVTNGIRQDVAAPVQRAFSQPQQNNARPAGQQRQGQPGAGPVRTGSGSGGTQGSAPQPRPHASILRDLTHNALTDAIGQTIQGTVNPVSKLSNDVVALGKLVNPAGSIDANKQSASQQVQPGHGIGHQGGVLGGKEITKPGQAVFIGPGSGSNIKKTVGTGVSLGTTFAAPEGGLMQSGSIAARVAKGAVVGAGIGATGSAGQQLADNGKIQLKPTLEGAAMGAVLGGGAPAVKAAAPVIKDHLPNEAGSVPLRKGSSAADAPKLPPSVGQNAEQRVFSQNPMNKGFILKETKPVNGRQDVITARKNPDTGRLETSVQSIDAPGKTPTQAPSTLKPDVNLDRSVQEILRSGTADEAMNHVMRTNGADLQTASKYVSRVAQQSGVDLGLQDAAKNPLLGSVGVPKVGEGDVSQANLNARAVHGHEQRVGQQAVDSYKKLTPKDQVLLKDIETNTVNNVAQKADNPQAFKQAVQSIRTYYDTRHAYDHYLGINVGYRTNYLRQVFDRVDKQSPDGQISLRSSNKNPGYTKQRTNETLGADVGNALQKDINGASLNHAKLTYEKGLNEALNGNVAKGELVRTPQDGTYQQIRNHYGQDLSVPKSVAEQINSRTWQPNTSKALNRYDAINHGLKYVKLSGGLFHAFTEAGNFTGQQLASGKLFKNPAATGKMFKVFFSHKAMDGEINRMAQSGVLDNAHISGLTTGAKEILADANVSALEKGTNAAAKYTGVQALHDATFKREIPFAKLKIFEQKTEGLNPNIPADLAKMRETARGINNLFGGINREVNGIRPEAFKWIQRVLLATDFTEGKWHTLFDAVSHGGPAGNLARQAVVGKAVLFALLASAGEAAFGGYKGKTPAQVGKNAAGNLLDPSFKAGGYTVGFPKTHVSEAVGAVKPYNQPKGAPWNASGLVHYASSRTAALPSEAIQLATNKNYYGQPIYGKNTKKNGGGPIGPASTALNVVNTVAPIPFGQTVSTVQGKQSPAAAGANVLGLNARPTPTPKKVATGSAKTQVSNGAQQPTTGIYQVKAKDGSTKYATLQGKDLRSFKDLGAAKEAQAKNKFKYSKQTFTTINGQQYHKSSTGNIVKGAPPAPGTSATKTVYDPKAQTWTKTNSTTGKVVKVDNTGATTVVTPGIGSIRNARQDYVSNIRNSAAKHGVDANAALAVAAAEGLGGGVGDNGSSFGPFQLHEGGALPQGKDQTWAESPAGIDYAMQQIAQVTKGKKGQAAIEAIVNAFEKPTDPNGEIARALAVYNGAPISLTSGTARSGRLSGTYATKNGVTTKTASNTRSSRGSASLSSLNTLLRTTSGIKAPSSPKIPAISLPTFKRTALKTFSPHKTSVSRAKISARKVA